jgi:CheY-like chemotaxis protein
VFDTNNGFDAVLNSLSGKKVLVADDDPAVVSGLESWCRALGLEVHSSSDGLRTLLKVAKEDPDLLILDLNLPDVDGFRVCERLTDPKFRPLPVIILTARSDENTISRCEKMGAVYLFKGPQLASELETTIRRLLEDKPENSSRTVDHSSQPVRVLVVDDDPVIAKSIAAKLSRFGIETLSASNGMQGFWLALREQPDIIFTDYFMAGGDGRYLLGRIKSTSATKSIPVVIMSGSLNDKLQRMPVERDLRGRGQAAGFIPKPTSARTLLAEIQRHTSFRVDPDLIESAPLL